ncbi:MAG: hypothetical protein HZB76_04970 [Chlamydiae bacterium]|nr:hypothetical protein [Chlamydiota bacterium]
MAAIVSTVFFDTLFFPLPVQLNIRKVQTVYEAFLKNKKTFQEYLDAISDLMKSINNDKKLTRFLDPRLFPFSDLKEATFQKKEGEFKNPEALQAALKTFNTTINAASSDEKILNSITDLFLKYKDLLTVTSSSASL